MIKNIIFDLGAVVVDWDPVRVAREYKGGALDAKQVLESDFFIRHWGDFDRGVYSQQEIAQLMAKETDNTFEDSMDVIEFVKNSLVDLPRTVALIKHLYSLGYDLYVLSNMPHEYYAHLKSREFFNYFKGQIISAQVNLIKPEPEIYQLTLERFNLKAEETLFIDDLKANVVAAEKEGIQTVHFADKEQGYKEIKEILGLHDFLL